MDGAQQLLSAYDIRVGQWYYNPQFQCTIPQGQFGTPYKSSTWGMHTTQIVSYSAPAYGWKANMLYPTKKMVGANYGDTNGQAPTMGIYTGVNNGSCNANGTVGSSY